MSFPNYQHAHLDFRLRKKNPIVERPGLVSPNLPKILKSRMCNCQS